MPPARTTFARPRPKPPTPDPRLARRRLPPHRAILAAATGAAAVFVCAATIVSFTGSPRAGAPIVRMSLAQVAEASAPPGWKSGLSQEPAGEAPFGAATVELTASSQPSAADPAASGEAIITLSDAPGAGAPQAAGTLALARAPIAGLFAQGASGPLPVIATDGRTSALAYARPFADAGKPKVALIIGGLGLNAQSTRQAIETLPPDVTLSFVPYAEGLQGWIDMARAAGHEVLLEAPMEPKSYPQNDPGPYTLMADAGPHEIAQKLDWVLSRATGYFGVTNYLGSKFLQSPSAVAAFEGELKQRGLAFVDDGSAARIGGALPRASADRIVDDSLDAGAISAQLSALEAEAGRTGRAMGSGFAYPTTLEQAAKWAAGLAQRGYQLAPVSAFASQR